MIGLGASSTLGIGLVVQLRDQFTQQANNISKSLNNLTGNAHKALGNTFGIMTKVGTGMTLAGYGITRGFIAATDSAMEFEKVLISVKALSGEIDNTQMRALGDVAMRLGPKFGMSATKVAEGMEELVKAGVATKDIPTILEQMVITAMGAGELLGGEQGVAARMTDLMMAFKITPEQVGRMGDILAKTAVESTVSFNSMAESFKYSQDVLKGFGFTLEESAAMIGVLGNVGLKGSIAGIALANAWKELGIAVGGGSKKKTKALELMGVSSADLVDEFGSLKRPLEIFHKIREGIKNMGDVQKSNVLNDLFGVRGKRAVSPLLEMLTKGPSDKWSGKSLTDMIDSLTNESAGSNMKILEEKSKSAAFQAERLKANWENFKIAIGNAIIPMLNRVIPMLSKMLEGLVAIGKTGFGKSLAKGIAVLGALLIPAGALLAVTGLIGKALLSTVGAFASFRMAGLWAYNTLIGRALAYDAAQAGVGAGMGINAAGSVYNKSTGRIVTTASTLGSVGGAAKGASTALGGLATVAGRLIPIVAGIAVAMAAFTVLTEDYIETKSPYVNYLNESSSGVLLPKYQTTGPGSPPIVPGAQVAMSKAEQIRKEVEGKDYKKGDTYINLHVDGKKTITKKINEGTENDANTLYGLNH